MGELIEFDASALAFMLYSYYTNTYISIKYTKMAYYHKINTINMK